MKVVVFLAPAQRALLRHRNEAARIVAKIEAYAENSSAFPKVKTLPGGSAKRLRIGAFRVIFVEREDTITVTKIAPRSSVYD